ncbi:GAF domain-containing protein [Kineococcus terrestris]|uniref:GAF domain-containing protein n=1 Tax=Kineococcus terrestris TaxID=2044856 RepID=UPI0034DB5E71
MGVETSGRLVAHSRALVLGARQRDSALRERNQQLVERVAGRGGPAVAPRPAPSPLTTGTREPAPASPELAVCAAMAPVVRFDRAAVVLLAAEDLHSALAGSDAALVAHLRRQLTVGEGPVLEARRRRCGVLVPDVRSATSWPLLAAAGPRPPFRALAALPLQTGGVPPVGVLCAARDGADAFGASERAALDRLADVLTASVLLRLDEQRPTALAPVVDDVPDAVSVAAGVLRQRHGLGVDEARALLRAAAFSRGGTAESLARAVLAGQADPVTDG